VFLKKKESTAGPILDEYIPPPGAQTLHTSLLLDVMRRKVMRTHKTQSKQQRGGRHGMSTCEREGAVKYEAEDVRVWKV
jgi:hypothetical protein